MRQISVVAIKCDARRHRDFTPRTRIELSVGRRARTGFHVASNHYASVPEVTGNFKVIDAFVNKRRA